MRHFERRLTYQNFSQSAVFYLSISYLKPRYSSILNYNLACCCTQNRNVAPLAKGRTYTEGV